MIQPYTKDDLERGEAVVLALHGLNGFEAWAEHIAKELAAERERAAQTVLALNSGRGNEKIIAECLQHVTVRLLGDSRRRKAK